MNSGVFLLWKTAFLMTSQLRHHYVCRANIDEAFYNFSVTRIPVRMICAKNCDKLSKCIEVTPKILSVLFSGTRCIIKFAEEP